MTKHPDTKAGTTVMVGTVAAVVALFLLIIYRIITGRGD
jgi:hypothetical protein